MRGVVYIRHDDQVKSRQIFIECKTVKVIRNTHGDFKLVKAVKSHFVARQLLSCGC